MTFQISACDLLKCAIRETEWDLGSIEPTTATKTEVAITAPIATMTQINRYLDSTRRIASV